MNEGVVAYFLFDLQSLLCQVQALCQRGNRQVPDTASHDTAFAVFASLPSSFAAMNRDWGGWLTSFCSACRVECGLSSRGHRSY
jgi:hypothetical protein